MSLSADSTHSSLPVSGARSPVLSEPQVLPPQDGNGSNVYTCDLRKHSLCSWLERRTKANVSVSSESLASTLPEPEHDH